MDSKPKKPKKIARKPVKTMNSSEYEHYVNERRRANTESARRRRKIRKSIDREMEEIYDQNQQKIEILENAVQVLTAALKN